MRIEGRREVGKEEGEGRGKIRRGGEGREGGRGGEGRGGEGEGMRGRLGNFWKNHPTQEGECNALYEWLNLLEMPLVYNLSKVFAGEWSL